MKYKGEAVPDLGWPLFFNQKKCKAFISGFLSISLKCIFVQLKNSDH